MVMLPFMKLLFLNHGKVVKVDDRDYEKVIGFSWHWLKSGYIAHTYRASGKISSISLHRFIFSLHRKIPGELQIDHINRDKLDNRYCNLRLANKSQQKMNVRFRGFYWDKMAKRFISKIRVSGKLYVVGRFFSEKEAHLAYIEAHKKYFGSFSAW